MHRIFLLCLVLLLLSPILPGYSVLTHEAIIDSAWEKSIKPVLLNRFPNSTADDLVKAHGYAYGGCIVQDMGYYPFGSKFFSDLVHYVRTGDFIVSLINESKDLNEYAFALGSLAHYAADTQGHSVAVNPAVGIEYPKLRRKYGNVVTYEDDPSAHLRVEFGFDVLQVARGNYAPQSYHDFIGFEVSKEVLERAFEDTYSLKLGDVFKDLDLALGTYRHAVSGVIPTMTQVAWNLKKDDLAKSQPGVSRRKFVYNLSRAGYHKEWDKKYEQPGIGTRILAFMIRILPKVGPLKSLSFKPPTPQTDLLFQSSFDKSLDIYRTLLPDAEAHRLQLPNRDFDTGNPTKPGEYGMADSAYAKLAVKLSEKDAGAVDPKVRQNVLAFFSDLNLPYRPKTTDPKLWQQTVAAVDKLKTAAPTASQ